MKIFIFCLFYSILLPLILFCQVGFGQNNSSTDAGIVNYRLLHFSFDKDLELSQIETAFHQLRTNSKSVLCAELVKNQSALQVICSKEITAAQIILYAEKKGFELTSTSDEILSKTSLQEVLLDCKGVSGTEKRRISRANYERLPDHKRAHIDSHPQLYIID